MRLYPLVPTGSGSSSALSTVMHYILAFLTITHGVLGCLGLISIARSQTNESLSELMNDLAADMTQLMSINRALLIAQ